MKFTSLFEGISETLQRVVVTLLTVGVLSATYPIYYLIQIPPAIYGAILFLGQISILWVLYRKIE